MNISRVQGTGYNVEGVSYGNLILYPAPCPLPACPLHPASLYLLHRTTNNMRGKSNLAATASMMLIWQVYKPGVKDDAGTSN